MIVSKNQDKIEVLQQIKLSDSDFFFDELVCDCHTLFGCKVDLSVSKVYRHASSGRGAAW